MNTNATAAERKKAVNAKMKQEQYRNCPTRTTVQIIDGCRYIVHSHFVGEKDLDEVMNILAVDAALNESETA
ncbi:MAG: hypothetical protein MJ100_08425 [Ruminococcus sp.]|nr:hypothetical protein [Ruminococcus sp.]